MNKQKNIILGVTVLAGLMFIGTLVRAGFSSPEAEVTDPATSPPLVSERLEGVPEKIIIPKIDVEADVQDVGIGKTGNMAVPTNYTDVGWYRYGTIPGDVGSAVIDGHVNNGFGLPAVFADLEKLKEGDEIFVEGEGGTRVRFVVEKVETYDREDVPTDILFNRKDAARLNLITCSGIYDSEEESYDKRTVVYAILK